MKILDNIMMILGGLGMLGMTLFFITTLAAIRESLEDIERHISHILRLLSTKRGED